MNFPPSKRGCIFSFYPKSEGYNGKSEGYLELSFTIKCLIVWLMRAKVKAWRLFLI